jgi:hypothetical protein
MEQINTSALESGDILDSPEACLARLPSLVRKRIETGEALRQNPPTIEQADFLHTVLCQVGMPRSKQTARIFERTNRSASLRLEAGALWDGIKWVEQPLPYGPKPRLAMIYITTRAIRYQTRTISLGKSFRQFLLALGVDTQGNQYASTKAQLKALAACRMLLGMSYGGHGITVDAKPFIKFEAWLSAEEAQYGLWPAEITLSQEFYDSLLGTAVPLARDALFSLKNSALALDIYTWLANRLHRVRRPNGEKLSWENLQSQFGQEYVCRKDFKREFARATRQVLCVYPQANIDEDTIGGIILRHSPPPILEKACE